VFLLQERDLVCYYNVADIYTLQQKENMMMRMGSNMAMDMDTGELHITSGWDKDEEE
jgi:hypothetical protein